MAEPSSGVLPPPPGSFEEALHLNGYKELGQVLSKSSMQFPLWGGLLNLPIAAVLLLSLALSAGIAGESVPTEFAFRDVLAIGLVAEMAITAFFLLRWVYCSWKVLPYEARYSSLLIHLRIVPWAAVVLLMIPTVSFFAAIVVICGLPFAYRDYLGSDNGGCRVPVFMAILLAVLFARMPIIQLHSETMVLWFALSCLVAEWLLMALLMKKVQEQVLKLLP